ncbi:MAG: carboxypeptidase regulatory-like domain-containing protein [Kofleriaceae bacterium]
MNSKRLGGVLVLVAVGLVAWWFLRHRGDHAAGKGNVERASNKVPSLATQHPVRGEAPSARSAAWDLDLDPEGPLQLEGQVLDGDGHGVGGAEIWLGSVPPRTAKTEGDGTFTFDKLVGRTYRLTARSGDLIGGPIAYKLTDTSDPAILQLAGAAKVIVSVHDDHHQPIANAQVKVDEEDGVTAKTGADGNATVGPVHPGWVGVHATADGFAPNAGFTSVGSANSLGRIDLVLHPGIAVTGHVLDEAGKPVAKARVSPAGLWNLGNSAEPVTTAADGAFALVLAAGTHTLVAADAEHAPSRSAPFVVASRPVDGVTITMKAGGRITGRVVDAKHQPVAFATVRSAGTGNNMWRVARRQATSNKDGTFELRGLSRTKLELRAESDTTASKIIAVDLTASADKKDVELVLDVAGTIAGVVVDDKGQPVPEVQVSSTPDVWGGADADSMSLAGFSTATTDGAGAFTIHGLPDGAYKLHAARHASEGRERFTDGTSAKTGDHDVKLTLASPGSIKGMIAKTDGTPPTIASVRAGFRAATPASAGVFAMDDLEPGSYDLTIHGPEFSDVIKRDVKVEAGKATDLGTITVARGRVLSGRVIDNNGAPVAGARVKVGQMLYQFQGAEDQMSTFEDAAGTRSGYTDQDGAFTVIGIPTKQTNAMAEATTGRSDAVEVAAGDDDPPAVTLTLRGFGTIVGKVTVKGQPATGVAITDTPKTGGAQIQIVQADDTGAFTVQKAAEGVHVLSAMQQGGIASFKSTSTTVTVTTGAATTVTIDIPVGTVALTVSIKPQAGAKVDAAQIFLFKGAVAMTKAKDVQSGFLGGGVSGMKFWTAMMPAVFDELVPGVYSACSIPITGNMSDSTFLQRLQESADILRVYCKPVTITASPDQQTLAQELPAMVPLPASKP